MNIGKHTKEQTPRRGALTIASSEASRLRIPDATREKLAAEADREVAARKRAAVERATPASG